MDTLPPKKHSKTMDKNICSGRGEKIAKDLHLNIKGGWEENGSEKIKNKKPELFISLGVKNISYLIFHFL